MNVPELKLPPEGFTMEDADKYEEEKRGFAYVIRELIDEDARSPYILYQSAEKMCEAINQRYHDLRWKIDQRAQEYLLRHNGVIDSWPDCTSVGRLEELEVNMDDIELSDISFDYFGTDFKVEEGMIKRKRIAREKQEFVYRNTYTCCESTDSYTKAEAKRKGLEERLKSARAERVPGFYPLYFPLGIIFTWYFLLTLSALFRFDGVLAPIQRMGQMEGASLWGRVLQVVCKVLFFPVNVTTYLKGFEGSPLVVVYWGAVVFLLAISVGLMYFFFKEFKWAHNRKSALERAEKEYNSFMQSGLLEKAVGESVEWKEDMGALAEQWHQAWFAWITANKKEVGETGMDRLYRQIQEGKA